MPASRLERENAELRSTVEQLEADIRVLEGKVSRW